MSTKENYKIMKDADITLLKTKSTYNNIKNNTEIQIKKNHSNTKKTIKDKYSKDKNSIGKFIKNR